MVIENRVRKGDVVVWHWRRSYDRINPYEHVEETGYTLAEVVSARRDGRVQSIRTVEASPPFAVLPSEILVPGPMHSRAARVLYDRQVLSLSAPSWTTTEALKAALVNVVEDA